MVSASAVCATPRAGRAGARACRWPARGGGEQGYNLVVLVVMVTVMNVAIATALPVWTTFVQREKEEEAIFRGLQYAEAIRVFQKRHGRLPIRLEELVEVEPRSIRQLYPNPLSESGKWGLLIQSQTPQGAPPGSSPGTGAGGERGGQRTPFAAPTRRQPQSGDRSSRPGAQGGTSAGVNPSLLPTPPGQPQGGAPATPGRYVAVPPAADDDEDTGGVGPRTTGPIVGVYPAVDGASKRLFFGQQNYSGWHFTTALIPMPVVLGGDRPIPRVSSEWVGKPFRDDLVPAGGGMPGGQPGGKPGAGNGGKELVPGGGTSGGRDGNAGFPTRGSPGGGKERRGRS